MNTILKKEESHSVIAKAPFTWDCLLNNHTNFPHDLHQMNWKSFLCCSANNLTLLLQYLFYYLFIAYVIICLFYFGHWCARGTVTAWSKKKAKIKKAKIKKAFSSYPKKMDETSKYHQKFFFFSYFSVLKGVAKTFRFFHSTVSLNTSHSINCAMSNRRT